MNIIHKKINLFSSYNLSFKTLIQFEIAYNCVNNFASVCAFYISNYVENKQGTVEGI